jgi:chromosome segregation ATPase
MSRANQALLVMLVTTLGLWGCAQRSTPGTNSARLRDLESRNAKLEEDYRAAVAARDQARKKVTAVEEKLAHLERRLEELQSALKERDELRQLVTTRTNERDAFQTQLNLFGKELQNLVGRIEAAAAGGPLLPVTSTDRTPTPGKS